jgi:hypothetical protein
MGLTDAQWAVLAPLIEQCRPRARGLLSSGWVVEGAAMATSA